jgi:hypothetical protein
MSVSCSSVASARLFEGIEDYGGSFLDNFQALGEEGRVAGIEVDVIRRSSVCLKTYGLADHERSGFGLGFAYCLGGCFATLGPVQHRGRQFRHKSENSSAEDWPGNKAIFRCSSSREPGRYFL